MNTFTFDTLLEKRIGMGKYQYIALLFLCFVDFNDGVELLSMSIITPILKNQWQISNFWVQVMSSIFYLGMLIGAVLTGNFADRHGRRITIIYASAFQFLVCCSFAMINSVFMLVLLRLLYGFCYGFTLPLTISMVSEITTIEFRGKCIIITNACVSVGKIWAVLLAYIFLDSFDSGNWRGLMITSSITSLVVVYGMIYYVQESPRFLLSIGEHDKAIDIINQIGVINKENTYINLSNAEIDELKQIQNKIFNTEEQANPKVLFSEKNLPITWRLWVIWFALIFIEFGQYVILPFIIQSQKGGFSTLLLAIIGEIPAIIVSLYFIDKHSLGRKNTLSISLTAILFLNIILYKISQDYFGLFISIERFFMKTCFSMIIPLTSELYTTNYRTVGYGFATGVGRFAATISPFVLLSLFYYDVYSGFIIFAILSIFAVYSSHTIPYDTTGLFLDTFLYNEEI